MSEDSEEDYSDRSISDEDESDEDTFMKFEDLHQCALLTADSITDPFFPRTTQILLEYQLGRWVPRLREPRDLYGVSSSGELSPTRWPYHCEVIDEKVQHIDTTPPYSEPVYIPTGLENEPIYSNSKEDTVVYLAEDAYKEPCFVYSRVGGNRTALKQPVDNCDSTLMFEARFESGNLQKVVKVAEYEYQLTVRPDLFTNKHTQWYYFQVTNTQAGIVYRFTIINFTKPASLYNRGMRPLFYSEKEAKTHNIGWRRIGEQIKYYRNNPGQDGRHYFSLTWTFQFPHSNDTCYFAHCYPYTYTNLQEYLSSINNDPVRSKFCKVRVLCHTIARNMVYILTITTPLKNADSRKRKAVILTARVHPGETNSSWIMKGFLDFILGSSRDAQLLRDTFIFKVVPMLNPDGVIVGNYRCSLAGRDLNRNYTSLLKESFPSVWYTRNMIHRLMEKREVILYCDLHGHSRKENIFMYGCGGSDKCKALYLQQRIFPLMMSKNCPDKYYQCLKELEEMQKRINLEKVLDDSDTSLKEITLESSSRGSDSSESNESQSYILKLTSQIKAKKKHLRTKKERNSTRARHQNAREEREIPVREMSPQEGYPVSNAEATFQVCGRGYLMPRHKESNSDVKATRPNVSDDRVFDYFRRQLPNQGSGKMPGQAPSWLLKRYLRQLSATEHSQGMIQRLSKYQQRRFSETRKRPIQEAIQPRSTSLYRNGFRVTSMKCTVSKPTPSWTERPRIPTEDLHNNLKSKMRQSASFQSKKTGVNWTDDEKRIYRDKKIAQTEEILQYLIPIMESTTNVRTSQIKRIFTPCTNFQIHHQILNPAPYVNLKRYSASWAPSSHLPFIGQRNLLASSSEWLQSVSQKSCESLSLFRGHKKRKACSAISAIKTKDTKPVISKWEIPSSGFEKGVTITKGRSSQAEESNQQTSMRIAPDPTQTNSEQPKKNEGQPTFHLKFQRQK
ncbi:cytosolic carboxypeptidase 3 isoform X3 [Eptesicus fuscus]|uniref:cytosolic carboxypeptidase 3 isoform X3 n=1 Tax=Eptesicus fuscus TaxID=29078 RepID=UPI0024048474|nr:cytosolic carboxypeptidase 3 isoform X3 [Eptesicus fuscus]